LEGHSQAGLQMDSESVKFDSLDPFRLAPAGLPSAVSRAAAQPPGCGKKSSSEPATRHQSPVTPEASLRDGEFFAVKDVSFELRCGELRTLGRSEKEISEKCLGATKVPDSGRRRHQCLGLIGPNGAGNQAAGQPLGRLPKVARRVRRRGKARINMTLLKMLNGLIKPDAGSITMRGRVGALIALGAAFPRLSALDARLHFPSMAPCSGSRKRNRNAGRRGGRVPQAGPEGFATREKREPNRRQNPRDHRLCRDSRSD